MSDKQLTEYVKALADGDFTRIADSFSGSGFSVQMPARGILQATRPGMRARLLLSVGIHGDETAPVEMLGQLLSRLTQAPHALAVDLMIVVGNPAAIAQGKRYLDADLNRMFSAQAQMHEDTLEAKRADEIMRATAAFFTDMARENWHLDLHSAIRPSHYPSFAVVPGIIASSRKQTLLGWLGHAGIGAAILNGKAAATYSAYTASVFGAASATLELGQVGKLGSNDMSRFAAAFAALDGFLRSGQAQAGGAMPHLFKVTQELIKHSERFRFSFDRDAWNFTPMRQGTVIAEDDELVYRVVEDTEYVVFPNPDVRNGLRAGLMVARVE